MIGAVVLAAGAGRRMGGVAKALLRTEGSSFLERIVTTARAANVERIVVVVGPPFAEAVRDEAKRLSIRGGDIVDNPDPDRGMASSIELGFRNLRDASMAYLWPVDHPDVTRATLELLARKIATHDAARPTFGGRGGHPPLLAKLLFSPMMVCSQEPQGARSVLATRDVIDVPVEDPGVILDVDRPEDLA